MHPAYGEMGMAELPGTTVAKPAGSARITALDSLRGLAALIVVFHHLDNALDLDGSNPRLGPIFHHSPLRLLIDGRCAVMLFFVLSGFALSISIGKNFSYWSYLVKRLCRLMIPCIAGVLIAAGAYLLILPKPIPELGNWFNHILWNEPVSWGLVARHILMTGAQADTSLVNVIWSLVIELRISLIFPVLYFLVKGRTKTAAVVAIAMQFLFRYLTKQSDNFVPFFNKNLVEALENIGYYIPFFIAGIIARENIDAIRGFVARLHKIVVFLILLGALKLEESGEDMQIGLGAFLIICICVSAPYISNALSVRPIEWLGRVSYSLYLVHLTILATFFHLFYGKINNFLISVLVVFGSLVFAHIVYRLVEAPSIDLGRWLTRKKPAVAVVTT
jgi:peptidoglycan/LPS O-acetylase OafA/YrhL